MISLQAQACIVTGLPTYLCTILPQVICTSKLYKGTFIYNCNGDNNSHVEINLKEDKSGFKKAKPVDRAYIKYQTNKNLPDNGSILSNHIYKEVKALTSNIHVTKKANHNLITPHKELLQ